MKLVINRFYPISQKAEIDLSKKMLIFVGKNNAGKTYVSKLIWSIYNIDDFILLENKLDVFETKITKKNEFVINLKDISEKIQKIYNKDLKRFLRRIFKNEEVGAKVIFEDKDWKNFKINVKFNGPIYKVFIEKKENSFEVLVKIEKKPI